MEGFPFIPFCGISTCRFFLPLSASRTPLKAPVHRLQRSPKSRLPGKNVENNVEMCRKRERQSRHQSDAYGFGYRLSVPVWDSFSTFLQGNPVNRYKWLK